MRLDRVAWYGIMRGFSTGITAGTTMVEAPMELIDGTAQGIVPIDEIDIRDSPDGYFSPIADVSDSVGTGPLFGK